MLVGDLVTLRPVEPGDYPVLARFLNDVEVGLLVGGAAPSPMPMASVASLYEHRRENPDEINFAIVAKDPGGWVIGQCGLFNHDLTSRTVVLGISIGDRDYWSRGYGRETVALLADYAFRVRNIRKLCLTVNANNERAVRAYKAVGFEEEGRRKRHVWNNGEYIDVLLMALFA